jgi:hypothetical protein
MKGLSIASLSTNDSCTLIYLGREEEIHNKSKKISSYGNKKYSNSRIELEQK